MNFSKNVSLLMGCPKKPLSKNVTTNICVAQKKAEHLSAGGCAAVIQPPMAIVQMSLADLGRGAHSADVCLVLCDLP